jgi:NADPH:quinone reductase-like Zn-dependent oxidoreductase
VAPPNASAVLAKACRVHRFGGPGVIVVEDVEVPAPAEREVRVRLRAAGVGPWDAWVRGGKSVLPQPLPLTLGADLAGDIEAVGEGVSDFAVGQAVFGATNARFTGAHADIAIADAGRLAHKPDQVSDLAAAATPIVAVTAWQALFEEAKLEPGETVVIHGAAGGVGAFAVQLARMAGLTVIGTAKVDDSAFVMTLGAAEVIDFRTERLESRAQNVDAVIDLVGGETQVRSFDVLRPGGRLVSTVSPPDPALAQQRGIEARFFLIDVTTARLERIAVMLASGELSADVGTVLPLAEARTAHEMLEGSRPKPRGKIVLAA